MSIKTCTGIFIATSQNNLEPETIQTSDEWINKLCYLHTVESCSAIQKMDYMNESQNYTESKKLDIKEYDFIYLKFQKMFNMYGQRNYLALRKNGVDCEAHK